MSARLVSGLCPRVIQVLKDFLPAELDLIDAEEADGIVMEDIAAGNYHEYYGQVIEAGFPACVLEVVSSTPVEVRPESFGKRFHAWHRINVMFTVRINDAKNPLEMQKRLFRYVAGALRVLTLTKVQLETTGDPTKFVHEVKWTAPITYGPAADQEGGTIIRTATLPIDIRRIEAR
jgi:hypothetical protein